MPARCSRRSTPTTTVFSRRTRLRTPPRSSAILPGLTAAGSLANSLALPALAAVHLSGLPCARVLKAIAALEVTEPRLRRRKVDSALRVVITPGLPCAKVLKAIAALEVTELRLRRRKVGSALRVVITPGRPCARVLKAIAALEGMERRRLLRKVVLVLRVVIIPGRRCAKVLKAIVALEVTEPRLRRRRVDSALKVVIIPGRRCAKVLKATAVPEGMERRLRPGVISLPMDVRSPGRHPTATGLRGPGPAEPAGRLPTMRAGRTIRVLKPQPMSRAWIVRRMRSVPPLLVP